MRRNENERVTAARWRALAERARQFQWSVGVSDARRIGEYVTECEAEAQRLERLREEELA